jgi:uncharacterized membrane protein YgaE (UPF0421/DUF939 family)
VYTTSADTALSYGLRRIAETFLGTVVAIAVNHTVFPPKDTGTADEGMK